jgi:hypothetical protein
VQRFPDVRQNEMYQTNVVINRRQYLEELVAYHGDQREKAAAEVASLSNMTDSGEQQEHVLTLVDTPSPPKGQALIHLYASVLFYLGRRVKSKQSLKVYLANVKKYNNNNANGWILHMLTKWDSLVSNVIH